MADNARPFLADARMAARVKQTDALTRTAVDEGHDVRVFLAGDAVHLAREATATAVPA